MLLLFLKVIFCCVSFEIVVILKTGSYHQFEIEKFGVSRFQINFQISQTIQKISNELVKLHIFGKELVKLLRSDIDLH